MKRKRVVATILSLAIMLLACACGQQSAEPGPTAPAPGSSQGAQTSSGNTPKETMYLTFAAPPTSSNLYPFCVGACKAISTAFPEYQITVSETQGAAAQVNMLRNGEAELANSVSTTDYENLHGLNAWDGQPNDNVRMLWYHTATPLHIIVGKDTGIAKLSDLQGTDFNPSGPGTSVELIIRPMLELFNIEPNYFVASQNDAQDAYANRQIVGTVNAGDPPNNYVLQMDASRKVDLISLSQEECDKICATIPAIAPYTIPAGTYDGIDHDVLTIMYMMGTQATPELSQQDGYNFCVAVFETAKDVWQAAYPSGAENDMIGMTLQSPVPLHAGSVQWLVEHGYDVPEEIIPPEYVPVA